MTFPHIEPEYKKNEAVQDYLQPDHIQKVMDINNAVMEQSIKCYEGNGPERDCLNCGNAECFMLLEAQAELWGMSLDDYIREWKQQKEEAAKAVEAQRLRFEQYYKEYEDSKKGIISKGKKNRNDKQPNIFDLMRAA